MNASPYLDRPAAEIRRALRWGQRKLYRADWRIKLRLDDAVLH